MVPVAVKQVGWVVVTVGAAGGAGWALIVTEVGVDIQALSTELLALME